MRFRYHLCGILAAAVLMLGAAVASPVIVVPDAAYAINVATDTCLTSNCSSQYNKFIFAQTPGTFQVPCSAALGAPNCAGGSADVAAGPILSVTSMTTLNHTQQSSGASVTLSYYYEVVCPTCAAGTIVPMSIAGSMEAHYTQGIVPANGTVGFTLLDRAFVSGYDSITLKDNVWVDVAEEGLEASSAVAGAPHGFGFCESTWTGYNTCNGGTSSPFGVPFYAVVNEPYNIFLGAQANVGATNQPFATDYAEANIDPVLSFGAGFDSTGYSLVLSSGIGNGSSTVPEPSSWIFLSTATLALVSGHRLRRRRVTSPPQRR